MNGLNLFCFPFAGGDKYAYNRYKGIVPGQINMIALELPGRGGRFAEALLTDLESMSEDLLKQVEPYVNKPFVFWGHSMGAILAYLVTRRLQARGLRLPDHLFLSGCRAPVLGPDPIIYHHLPKDRFLEELKKMGGSPEELLENADVMNLYEPIIRADFRAVETYEYTPGVPLSIPITTMIGRADRIKREEALAWRTETDKDIVLKEFSGGHFFIFEHEHLLMRVMAQRLFS
jgi:surfactin synthase thioesterase subunit